MSNSRTRDREQRRKFFAGRAAQGGAAPHSPAPTGTAGIHGARGQIVPPRAEVGTPTHVLPSTMPPAQIQPHQVRQTSGLPGSQPHQGQPGFAPQSGQIVPVTVGPRPATAVPPRLPSSGVPAVPRADVTVILYSSGSSSNLLGQQLQALRRQTVQPSAILVHADGPHGHDQTSLLRLSVFATPIPVGRHFRLGLARTVGTAYVAILEEDAMPGARWLERAMEAITAADRDELDFGPAVIACSGVLQGSADPSDGHVIGPELPRGDQPLEVDYGRHGWLFATEFARVAEGLVRVGNSTDSLGLLLAVAARSAEIPTVVMDYGAAQEHWGSTMPKHAGIDSEDAGASFSAYLELGWQPAYYGQGMQHAVAPASAVPGQRQLYSSGGPPQTDAQGRQLYTDGAPAPAQPPTRREPKVTHMGGMTMIERVLEPHEQTPDPSASRSQIVPPSPPPLSAHTEQIVPPSPPPQSAFTEQLVSTEPPKSQTGQ